MKFIDVPENDPNYLDPAHGALAVPTPGMITALRMRAGFTQQQAAELVHLGAAKRWSEYERGVQAMDAARWELFRIKCGVHQQFKPAKSARAK